MGGSRALGTSVVDTGFQQGLRGFGINGFGRIGRNVLRAANEMGSDLQVVAVNDIGDPRTFAHLLKHDTALGTFRPSVEVRDGEILVDGTGIRFLSVPEPG